VSFYKDIGARTEQAQCRRCGEEFASRMHVEDLVDVERAVGYQYEVADERVEHYQWICPRCRRALLAIAQANLWTGVRGGMPLEANATANVRSNGKG